MSGMSKLAIRGKYVRNKQTGCHRQIYQGWANGLSYVNMSGMNKLAVICKYVEFVFAFTNGAALTSLSSDLPCLKLVLHWQMYYTVQV